MEYTAEQQKYQQQYQNQPQAYEYDPSQYDHQSAASYYAYAYPNQQQQQQHQQQSYQYYPPQDSYSQQYPQFYQETVAPIHPPGVPLDHHNQPAVYYPPQPAVDTQHQHGIPVSGSDSAALGNLAMVQRDNRPPQMQPAYRGGRRGGRPFRGGRGHNGSKHTPSNAVKPGHATLPAQVAAAPLRPPPRMAWCELCRVDCNTPEILEQHKNGKRHKKNLQLREELQKLNKVVTGQQSVQVPNLGSEVVRLEKVAGSEEKQQEDTFPSLSAANDNKKETEQQQDIVNKFGASTSGPAEDKRKSRNPSDARGHGFKRKMRGGRGGKYMKSHEGSRRPVEPPKQKGGIPFMCELCNVKCETQLVFNSHLAGKKHIANTKRFHGHRALYGEAGLQALYPPNITAPSPPMIPQIQQGLTDPQVVLAQLLTYVLSQAQVPGLAAPQVPLPVATLESAQIPLSSWENQYRHELPQGSLATAEVRNGLAVTAEAETGQQSTAAKSGASPTFAGNNKANSQTSESEKNEVSQQQSFTAQPEVPPTAGTHVKVENAALGSETKAVIHPTDNSIMATSEYITTGGKPLLSSTSTKDTETECKTVSLDRLDESESKNNLEEPEEEAEDDLEDQNEAN